MSDRIDYRHSPVPEMGLGEIRLTVEVDAIRRGFSQFVQSESLKLDKRIAAEIERQVTSEKFEAMLAETVRLGVENQIRWSLDDVTRKAVKDALADPKLRERVRAKAAKLAAAAVDEELDKVGAP